MGVQVPLRAPILIIKQQLAFPAAVLGNVDCMTLRCRYSAYFHRIEHLMGSGKSGIARISIDIRPIMHNHIVVDRLGVTFAALADPTRRAMIERLSHGPACVHDLTVPFALSQQMISKHIAYLVRARIVIKTKRGRESICTLRPRAIKTVSDWAISYRQFWEESFEKLDVVLNQMKKAEVGDDKKHGE